MEKLTSSLHRPVGTELIRKLSPADERYFQQERNIHAVKMETLKKDMETVFQKKVEERTQNIIKSERKLDEIHNEV